MTLSQSTDWNLLRHAYGTAGDIPSLLVQVRSFPLELNWQSEPWFSLWSSLYHQGDIYPASIATVPHIVSALSEDPGKATLSFYLLPASIAIADNSNPVGVAPEIRRSFKESLSTLGSIASTMASSISDPDISKAAQAAALISIGSFRQAEDLLKADA